MKTATAPLPPLRSVKVLDQLRERIRYLHYSLQNQTGLSLGSCAHPFPLVLRHPATARRQRSQRHFCHGWRTGAGFGLPTHRRALALLFFYGKVLDLPRLPEIGRPRPSRRSLPVVLTPDEAVRILGFSGRRASFVLPSSVWNGHADR